jgi:hypothetical protein
MRYHWGLAIGHLYTHGQAAPVADLDLDMQVSDKAPPSIGPDDLEDVAASSRMDADVHSLVQAAEQTFSNDVQEEHGDMECGDHGPSAGDDYDCDSDVESLDKGSEVADDDVEMEREDETDDEAVVMMEEMYF